MSLSGSHYLARTSGIWPAHYISIDLDTKRDRESWWVQLTPDKKKAKKWTVEQTAEGHLKIGCDIGGRTAFLTAHGYSCQGHTPAVGRDCFAALVHFKDDENALWHQHTVDGEGTTILRKAKMTNQGFALKGICFPELLHQSGDLGPGPWRPLPYNNVVVAETNTQTIDHHVLWSFLAVQDGLEEDVMED